MPLTHRGLTRTVTFATGHDAAADLDRIALSDVLVLYMAAHQLGSVAARLIAAGRDQSDAVALIQDATRPEQNVQVTTLAEATDQPFARAPTMVVIGPVVTLRQHLQAWQQTTPMIVVNEPQQTRIAG